MTSVALTTSELVPDMVITKTLATYNELKNYFVRIKQPNVKNESLLGLLFVKFKNFTYKENQLEPQSRIKETYTLQFMLSLTKKII